VPSVRRNLDRELDRRDLDRELDRRGPQKPAEPVYWGFGGKLRPDAWKPAGARADEPKKELPKKEELKKDVPKK
jgi:hypothetical protein